MEMTDFVTFSKIQQLFRGLGDWQDKHRTKGSQGFSLSTKGNKDQQLLEDELFFSLPLSKKSQYLCSLTLRFNIYSVGFMVIKLPVELFCLTLLFHIPNIAMSAEKGIQHATNWQQPMNITWWNYPWKLEWIEVYTIWQYTIGPIFNCNLKYYIVFKKNKNTNLS